MDTVTEDKLTNSKSRILYVTKTSILDDGGGGEKRAREVLSDLSSSGFDSTVVCGRTSPELERWDEYEECRVRHVGCVPGRLLNESRLGFLLPRYLFAFTSLPVIALLFVREEFDVVVENMTPYPTLTVLLAKLFDIPIVAVQHEFHGRDCLEMYDPLTGRIQLIVQNILRLVEYDAIVVPVGYTKRKLREYGVVTDQIDVVPNGIDFAAYSHSESEREDSRLVTVGRLCKRKGQDDLLRAFARLHDERPETHLDIVGKGPQRDQLAQLASRLGITDAVTFHGFVSHEEKVRLLNQAELFVFASKQEGFGLALLEAMAAGLPVVARKLPVYEEFFEDGQHGRLLEPFQTKFPEVVEDLLLNEAERVAMRNQNHATAEQFDWSQTAEGMASVINSVVPNDGINQRDTGGTQQ